MTSTRILGVAIALALAALLGGCDRGGNATNSQAGTQQDTRANNTAASGSQEAGIPNKPAATGTQQANSPTNAAANGNQEDHPANKAGASGPEQGSSANNAIGAQPDNAPNSTAAAAGNGTPHTDQKTGDAGKTRKTPNGRTAVRRDNGRPHRRLYGYQPSDRCQLLRREGRRLPRSCR
jgi:hypothetical protein